MRNFINRFSNGNQSILNLEKGDIVYLRALGGISQAKVIAIQSILTFSWSFCGMYNHTTMTLLLPNGETIDFDSKVYRSQSKDIHIFLSYEDCRRNANEIGKYHSDDSSAGRDLVVRIIEKYNLKYCDGYFDFYAPTASGVKSFSAKKLIYNHDGCPIVFNIYDKYIGNVSELANRNIHTSYEQALEAHKPKAITFESVAKPKTKRVRITRVFETEVPVDEVADFIENAHEYEYQEGDECTTFAETI